MGAHCSRCCCCYAEEYEDHPEAHPGPKVDRRCTDCFCLLVFTIHIAGFATCFGILHRHSSAQILFHGRDHCRNFCNGTLGRGKYTYYPNLANELDNQEAHTGVQAYYGVCVEACPDRNDVVQDYPCEPPGKEPVPPKRPFWFAAQPTFPMSTLSRCVPFDPGPEFVGGSVAMCADPPCVPTAGPLDAPTSPREVCGLQRDMTRRYWLLGEPDVELMEAWRSERASDELIRKRAEVAKTADKAACNVRVLLDRRIRLVPAGSDDPKDEWEQLTYRLLTRYAGVAFRTGTAIYKARRVIFGLGVLGALALSMGLICCFTCCVRGVVVGLLILLFAVLGIADYLLFLQAGVASGEAGLSLIWTLQNSTGLHLPSGLDQHLLVRSQIERMRRVALVCAWSLAIFIVLLLSFLIAARRSFEVMIALFREASKVVRQMPSMLLSPILVTGSMLCASLCVMFIFVGLISLDPPTMRELVHVWNSRIGWMRFMRIDGEVGLARSREAVAWILVFGFVWIYFFHVAVFTLVTATIVSTWYFYRDDPVNSAGTGWSNDRTGRWFPGRSVVLAYWLVGRYHLGSAAWGSFVMATATMPRIVLEYVARQTSGEDNSVVRTILWAARCLLWCLERCLQFLTEYAYVYTAVTGKAFCPAARKSFRLISKYPLQVGLDKMMSTTMGFLACVTLPLGLAVISSLFIKEEQVTCALLIAALAYITVRLVVGVYDICVTTLFVCVMRDTEHYGGRYMPDSLFEVCGLKTTKEEAVEMRATM